MKPARGSKRVREDDVSTELFWGEEGESGSYLTVKLSSGQSMKEKGWPWIQHCIRGILGGKERVSKASFLGDGRLLVKTKDVAQTEKLMKVSQFGGEDCDIVKDKKLNQSKGTIYAHDLIGLSEDDIVGWLGEFGVTEAKRFTRKVDGRIERTPTVLLTFDRPSCPERLELDYVIYRVRRHVPNPLQCYNCGKYSHTQAQCSVPKKCLKCGADDHSGQCAQHCINCDSTDHSCLSRACPVWRKEKDICEIKVSKDISYAHARRVYDKEHQAPQPTVRPYATIVRKPTETTSQEPVLRNRVDHIEKQLEKVLMMLNKIIEGKVGDAPDRERGTNSQEGDPSQVLVDRSDSLTMTDDRDQDREMSEGPGTQFDSTQSTDPSEPTLHDAATPMLVTSDVISPPSGGGERGRSLGTKPRKKKDLSEDRRQPGKEGTQSAIAPRERPQQGTRNRSVITDSQDFISPSPEIGTKPSKQGGAAGNTKSMPSLTRKPPTPP